MRPKKYKTALITNIHLKTWKSLNEYLMSPTTTHLHCEVLLKQELDGRARKGFVYRINHRLNKLRNIANLKHLDEEMKNAEIQQPPSSD